MSLRSETRRMLKDVPPFFAIIAFVLMIAAGIVALRDLEQGWGISIMGALGGALVTTALVYCFFGDGTRSRHDVESAGWRRLVVLLIGIAVMTPVLHFVLNLAWLPSLAAAPALAIVGLLLLSGALGGSL